MPRFIYRESSIWFSYLTNLEGDKSPSSNKDKSLVFLHGFLEDHSIWKDIIPEFILQGYGCLVVDLPCHGASRFKGKICTMSYMAEIVNVLIAELKLSPAKAIGHSMGGYVALELNALRSVEPILLHSNFWADSDQKNNDRNRVIAVVKTNKELFINEAIPGLFANTTKERHTEVIAQLKEKAKAIPAHEICAATAGMRDRRAFYEKTDNTRISIIHGTQR